MSARLVSHCWRHPLLCGVWPATGAATVPLLTTAASQASNWDAAVRNTSDNLHKNIWRGFAAETSSVPSEQPPWSQEQGQVPKTAALQPGMFAKSFKSRPVSLVFDRGDWEYPSFFTNNILGRGLMKMFGGYSSNQRIRNGAVLMYQGMAEAADNTELQQALGLDASNFIDRFNLMSLHMWLVINRLNQEPESKQSKLFLDVLYTDCFYKETEQRVAAHGVKVRLGKWVDRLQKQFYGTSFAYDKAIRLEGSPEFALTAALVKNMYHADEKNLPWAALTARYLIRQLECLDRTNVDDIYKGHIKFSYDVVKS